MSGSEDRRFIIETVSNLLQSQSYNDAGRNGADKEEQSVHHKIVAVPTIETQTSADERKHQKNNNPKQWIPNLLLALTVIGSVASVVLSVYSLKEARQAIAEARRQGDIIQDQEKRQLRAYLGIVNNSFNISCITCRHTTKPLDNSFAGLDIFSFQVKNFGLTPASKVIPCIDLIGLPSAVKDSEIKIATESFFAECEKTVGDKSANPTVRPSDTRNQGYLLIAEKIAIFDEAYDLRKIGVFLGLIRYTDTFGESHETVMCRLLIREGQAKIAMSGCSTPYIIREDN